MATELDQLLGEFNRPVWRARPLAIVAALAVIGALTAGAYYTLLRPSESATPDRQTATVTRGAITTNVSLSGSIAAQSTSGLTFAETGTVSRVNVTLGQEVKAGDVLAELDSPAAKDGLRQAELNLQAAQISLSKMLEGATPADKASAQQSVVQATTTLKQAEDALKKLHAGPTTSELLAAQQAVATAQSQVKTAEANLDKLEDAGASKTEIAAAKTSIQAAKLGVSEAQAKLTDLTNGPDAIDVQSAQSAITAAKAGLESAIAKRDEVLRGAEPNDIALQQNTVAKAQLAYDTAKETMAGATLVAPFDGTVAELNIKVGDAVGAGSDTAPITLHTPNSLKIELTVGDTDYQDLEVGQKGFATVSSLDNASFPIEIESIGSLPSTNQGVVTYKATARILDLGTAAVAGINSGAPVQVQISPDGSVPPSGRPEAQQGSGAPPATASTPEAKPTPLPGHAGTGHTCRRSAPGRPNPAPGRSDARRRSEHRAGAQGRRQRRDGARCHRSEQQPRHRNRQRPRRGADGCLAAGSTVEQRRWWRQRRHRQRPADHDRTRRWWWPRTHRVLLTGWRDAMIGLRDVSKVYRAGDVPVPALRHIDLQIGRGEFVSIMGASGSGKSTLMNILGILDDRLRRVLARRTRVRGLGDDQLAARTATGFIGFVFQSFNLLPFKTGARERRAAALLPGRHAPASATGSRCSTSSASASPTGCDHRPTRDVGRPEAARGDRARADRQAAADPRRRADRRARLETTREIMDVVRAPQPRARHHDRLRHPRPRGRRLYRPGHRTGGRSHHRRRPAPYSPVPTPLSDLQLDAVWAEPEQRSAPNLPLSASGEGAGRSAP